MKGRRSEVSSFKEIRDENGMGNMFLPSVVKGKSKNKNKKKGVEKYSFTFINTVINFVR